MNNLSISELTREEVKRRLAIQRASQAARHIERVNQPCAVEDALDRAELLTGKRPTHIGMVCSCPRCKTFCMKSEAAVELGRKGGLKGGDARADKLSPERRSEIARSAAKARWHGKP